MLVIEGQRTAMVAARACLWLYSDLRNVWERTSDGIGKTNMPSASSKLTPRERPEEKERYYLLPGQGGSSYRRKQRYIIKASIIVGLIVSAVFAAIMYFVYRVPR